MPLKVTKFPIEKQLEIALAKLENQTKVGKVGWFKNDKYTTPEGKKIPVAYVAMIQEEGYAPRKIPPRPFLRPTAAEQKNTWQQLARTKAKGIASGEETGDTLLEAITQKAAGDFRKAITQLQSPPLKEATIKNRLRKRKNRTTVGLLTKPLVDSGVMLNTLSGSVEDP